MVIHTHIHLFIFTFCHTIWYSLYIHASKSHTSFVNSTCLFLECMHNF